MKATGRILSLSILLLLCLATVASAQDSQLTESYWLFETDAPVSVVQAGDLDGDSLPEVMIGTADGQLMALKNNGDLVWQLQLDGPVSALIHVPGEAEQGGSIVAASTDGTVLCLDNDGQLRWRFAAPGGSTMAGGLGPFLQPVVAAGDVDGDGLSEIAIAGGDGRVYLLSNDGQLRWVYEVGRPLISVATADLDGDSRVEIVPGPLRGDELVTLDGNGSEVWKAATTGEVGLVQPGDTDGDGQAEVVLLTSAWDLYVFESEGQVAWHDDALALSSSHSNPLPGQLATFDLEGDGRAEIVLAAPLGTGPGVYAFTGSGRQRWTYPSAAMGTTSTLVAAEVAGPGTGGVLVAESARGPLVLLDQDGRPTARYYVENLTRALALRDLDGSGWSEIIAGSTHGLQALGATMQTERRQLWQRSLAGPATGIVLADLAGDGERAVAVGTQSGRIYAFDAYGRTNWDIALGASVLCMAAGEVDGDGREEIAASTWDGSGNSQIHLLDSNRRLWSIPTDQPMTALVIGGEGIVAGGGGPSNGVVVGLDSRGEIIWHQAFPERVTAVGYDAGQLLAGVQSGALYSVDAEQIVPAAYNLGGAVTAVAGGWAATAGGQLYQLKGDSAVPVSLPEGKPQLIQISQPDGVFALTDGRIVEPVSGDLIWQEQINGLPTTMFVGRATQSGPTVVAVGSDKGRLHFYGPASNQPPLLTQPSVAETRTGYAYSIDVHDPDGDTVIVGLVLWDPSAGRWLKQQTQPLDRGQGRLSWEVPAPFDTWDAGRDSQYRFTYDDGFTAGVTATYQGPLAIAVDPWYLFYGRYVAAALLSMLVISSVFLLVRRDRARKRSPVGQAESVLAKLTADRSQVLPLLSELASDPRWVQTVLPHLPGLARASDDADLGDLIEGYYLMASRPDYLVEGLAAVLAGLAADCGFDPSEKAGRFYRICLHALEASGVADIASLKQEVEASLDLARPAAFLSAAWKSLSELLEAIVPLHNYQRADMSEDKVAYLAEAIELLGGSNRRSGTSSVDIERGVVEQVRDHWLGLVATALRQLQGRAQLEVTLRSREAVAADAIVLMLDVSNQGQAPAYNISLESLMRPGIAVTPVGGSIKQLPAGGHAQVELAVTPAEGSELQVALALHYDDRERSGKVRYFSDRIRLLEVPKQFTYIPNPYATGKPLRSGSPVFVGRDDIFTYVEENLGRRGSENVILLVGQRRMGKTSILRQITGRLDPAHYLPVFLDGQTLGFEGGPAGLFYDIAIEIQAGLVEKDLRVEAPSLAKMEADISMSFEREFLPMVTEVLGSRVLVLMLDEFEELELRVRTGELPSSIFAYLRHLMQHSQQIAFIMAGTHGLEELAAEHWSALFNIALCKRVSFLDEVSARHLIVEPVRPYGMVFDELAIDKMLRVTACHPYFLQLLCYVLVGLHNRDKVNYITTKDVSWAMEQVVELGGSHLSLLWAERSSEEQSVLVALSRLLAAGRAADNEAIAVQLGKDNCPASPTQVGQIVKTLVRREIIRAVDIEPIAYNYTVELVRLWVERYQAAKTMKNSVAWAATEL